MKILQSHNLQHQNQTEKSVEIITKKTVTAATGTVDSVNREKRMIIIDGSNIALSYVIQIFLFLSCIVFDFKKFGIFTVMETGQSILSKKLNHVMNILMRKGLRSKPSARNTGNFLKHKNTES